MANENNKGGIFKIRPAARHILTIGRDLIKDNNTAILELIKNAYDADAEHVAVDFYPDGKKDSKIKIKISDDGHGMTYDTVTKVWMVPSTAEKVKKPFSEMKHRNVQGKKGIGRYAASILGDELFLETTRDKETTSLVIDWKEFNKKDYLDDIDILIERNKQNVPDGTAIEVVGDHNKLLEWDETQIKTLIKDLRRLLAPIHGKDHQEDFKIQLNFHEFPIAEYKDKSIDIEPFPILEFFDYRISGEVSASGEANLIFENGARGVKPEKIKILTIPLENGAKYCGNLKVDFKIYDRDAESIESLIGKGLVDPESGEKLGKTEARALLDDIAGIGVYRAGFRIRPHGDPGYDWLTLDKRRVQKPSIRVGSDRVSGFIEIEAEEKSHLEEKANREGLKENKYYEGLVQIAIAVLLAAENERHAFKLKIGKHGSRRNLTQKLADVFDFSDIKDTIGKELSKYDIPHSERDKILNLLGTKAEEGNKVIEDVKEVIIAYQGQATLGKIVKVILHEGRNPISYFQNEMPAVEELIGKLKKKFSKRNLGELSNRLNGITKQSQLLINIFNKINPLAARRRGRPVRFSVAKNIQQSLAVFTNQFKENKIKIEFKCDEAIAVTGWPEDLTQALVNLLDNSYYWLLQEKNKTKEISIVVSLENDILEIEYKDSGPGIEEKFIKDGMIFEPGFSTKPEGTGLGLAIAGEAIQRNSGTLRAVYSESGARFEIEWPVSSKEIS